MTSSRSSCIDRVQRLQYDEKLALLKNDLFWLMPCQLAELCGLTV